MNPPGDRALLGVCALLFAASAAVTVVWCSSMGVTSGMPMPGNWTMSMAWMRMPGQTWLAAGASFLTMWIAMMVAMMLPSLVPMLRHYREAVVTSDAARLGQLTVTVAVAYFFVWRVRNRRLRSRGRTRHSRDAAACAGTCGSDNGRPGRCGRRCTSIYALEGASPRVLLRATRRRPRAAVGRRYCMVARRWSWAQLRSVLRWPDRDSAGRRHHGSGRGRRRETPRSGCDSG